MASSKFISDGEAQVKEAEKQPFQAAKSYEQAAFAARDVGEPKKIPDLINKAYSLYVENGTPDTAGTLLDRTGKMLEEQLPEQAVAMYRKAGDLAQIHDKGSQASEMLDRASRLLVKMEKYIEAAKVLEDLLENEARSPTPPGRRYALCLILVQLKLDDYVAGKKAYEIGLSIPDPTNSAQLSLGKSLLDSYDTGDREALKAVTANAFIRSLDPVYARLARSLDVPDGGGFGTESGGGGDGRSVGAGVAVSVTNSSGATPREFPSTPSPVDSGRDGNENRSATQDDDDLT